MKFTKDAPRNAIYALHTSTDAGIMIVYVDKNGHHRAYIEGSRETFYDVEVSSILSTGNYHAHMLESHYTGHYRKIPRRKIKQWVKHVEKCRLAVGDNNLNILAWLGGFNPLKK